MKLEVKNINKSFGEHHVLKNVSFQAESGKIFGYLGRNGAGKTTSIRILMEVFHADSGEILIDGEKFDKKKYRVGYLPEERGMYSKSTVFDQLVYFARLRGMEKKEAEESVIYWTKKFQIDQYLKRNMETLSKGNQQKVQITQAFLNNPHILILDEPFSGLDPVNSQVFQDALVEFLKEDKIIIFSSHQMSYVESFCNDIAIINFGEIVLEGNLKEIKKEMGQDKIHVSFNEIEMSEFESFIKELGLEFTEGTKGVIVDLKEKIEKKEFLKKLINKEFDIHQIGEYEPGLQEIFVGKVGENV